MDFQLVFALLACCLGIAKGTINSYHGGLNLGGSRSVGAVVPMVPSLGIGYGYSGVGGGGRAVGNVIIRGGGAPAGLLGPVAVRSGSNVMRAGLVGNFVAGGGIGVGAGASAGLVGSFSNALGLGNVMSSVPVVSGANYAAGIPNFVAPGIAGLSTGSGLSSVSGMIAPALGSSSILSGLQPMGAVGVLPSGGGSISVPTAAMPAIGGVPIGAAGVLPSGGVGAGSGRLFSSNYFGTVVGRSGDAYGGSANADASGGGTAVAIGGTAVTGSGVGDTVLTGVGTGVTSGNARFSYGGDYYGSAYRGAYGNSYGATQVVGAQAVGMQCGEVRGSYCPAGLSHQGNCKSKKGKCKVCCRQVIQRICKTKGKKGPSYYYC